MYIRTQLTWICAQGNVERLQIYLSWSWSLSGCWLNQWCVHTCECYKHYHAKHNSAYTYMIMIVRKNHNSLSHKRPLACVCTVHMAYMITTSIVLALSFTSSAFFSNKELIIFILKKTLCYRWWFIPIFQLEVSFIFLGKSKSLLLPDNSWRFICLIFFLQDFNFSRNWLNYSP